MIKDMRRRNLNLGMVELWHRVKKCGYIHHPEQSTYSSADFLGKLAKWYARREIYVECIQTDNDFEFTNGFLNGKRNLLALFEQTTSELGIRHKLIYSLHTLP